MYHKQCFFSFREFGTRLLLATHSKTDCNSLLKVSVTSLAVVADVYMVESTSFMDTHACFNYSCRSLVQIENSRGPGKLPCSTPHFTCLTLEKRPLSNFICHMQLCNLHIHPYSEMLTYIAGLYTGGTGTELMCGGTSVEVIEVI